MTKQMYLSFKIFATTLILSFLLTSCSTSQQNAVPREMLGTWVGFGHHVLASEFLDQKEISVMLIITEKGNISGYIGDASIQKTELSKTPWWLRLIGNEKYRSIVQLSGNIVNQESFKREGGTLFFRKLGTDEMICDFTSIGSKVDSKNMALPIKNIVLRHPE